MKRDTRDMLLLSSFLTLAMFPVFGLVIVATIIIDEICKWIF